MSETHRPQYVVSPECQPLMDAAGLSLDDLTLTHEQRHDVMLVPTVPTHLYSLRWNEDGTATFVSAEMTRMEWQVDRARPAEVTFRIALKLKPELPAGKISREMAIDQIWTRVAESFGVPVKCHEKQPASARYTGRWDGEPPRVTAEPGDTVIVDGGLDTDRKDAKYVWALSSNKYLAWLRGESTATATADDASRALPRLVFARMQPTALKKPVIVRADIGEAAVRLLCNRCSIVEIDDPPHFHPTVRCLFVFGAEMLDQQQPPSQVQGKEYIIPLHYVTDIRPGPAAYFVGDSAPQRSAVLPNDFRPGHKMSQKAIESLLAEMTP